MLGFAHAARAVQRLRRKVKVATQAVAWPLLFCAAKKVSKKGGSGGDGGFPHRSPPENPPRTPLPTFGALGGSAAKRTRRHIKVAAFCQGQRQGILAPLIDFDCAQYPCLVAALTALINLPLTLPFEGVWGSCATARDSPSRFLHTFWRCKKYGPRHGLSGDLGRRLFLQHLYQQNNELAGGIVA